MPRAWLWGKKGLEMQVRKLMTERRNPATENLDRMSALEMVTLSLIHIYLADGSIFWRDGHALNVSCRFRRTISSPRPRFQEISSIPGQTAWEPGTHHAGSSRRLKASCLRAAAARMHRETSRIARRGSSLSQKKGPPVTLNASRAGMVLDSVPDPRNHCLPLNLQG